MKQILIILAFIFIAPISNLKAQEVITDEINYNVMEKLIQLAKDYHPQRKAIQEQENIAKNNVTIANLSYLDVVNANYFWRPDGRETINPENPYVTNGIQFGINFNPSSLFSKPFQVKSAKSNHKIMQYQKQLYEVELENQVKSLYYNYVLKLKEFKLKTMAVQTAKGSFLDISNSYQRGEISSDDYNAARDMIFSSDYSKLESEIAYLSARDDLEGIIGIKLVDFK